MSIEWRESDDHVLMTGPVEYEHKGRFDAALAAGAGAASMSVEVVTFGCRLNAAESEVIRREAERAGFSDTVVVNTCAVTAEAVRQARQTIRALRRERPQAKIVVTGCAAQTEPQTFVAMAEADHVLGNAEKSVRRPGPRRAPRSILTTRRRRSSTTSWRCKESAAHLIDAFAGRTRAFVQVQNGCDHRCTFCIIPLRPRQFALGADGRRGRRRAPAGRATAIARSC